MNYENYTHKTEQKIEQRGFDAFGVNGRQIKN